MSEEIKNATISRDQNPVVEVDFEGWIRKGFEMFKTNAGSLIVAVFLAVLLSACTLGILAGPMLAGLAIMTIQIFDGESVEIGDVFKGFQFFLPSFLFLLVWGFIFTSITSILVTLPLFGTFLGSISGFFMGTFLMFAIPLIVDKEKDFWSAAMESIDCVKKVYWPLFGIYSIACLIGSAGIMLFGIGIILTLPITYCINIVAYRNFFSK